MAQSLNTKVDLTVDAISYLGLPKYGKIMIGDKSVEFYNNRTVNDNMIFPWTSIKLVQGEVSRDKIGRTFYIVLQNKHKVRFSSQEAGKILKVIRDYIGDEKVLRAPSIGNSIKEFFKRFKIN
ncbi:MAG: DUF956 family protein [Streptococcaceae bacterium]|jgi:hypothetical protein|nr:DUF956 family protein [Streptococcaceae bacterium]